MPSFRTLPSGKTQATVRLPDGKRVTYTHQLPKAAKNWAREMERNSDMGLQFVDLRAGRRMRLTAWHEQWVPTLTVAKRTLATYESAWRVHIEPYLGDRGVASISRMDVMKWQADMERKHRGGKARMRGVALHVLSLMLKLATQSAPPLRTDNPCAGLTPPKNEAEPGYALSVEEANRLRDALPPRELVMVDLMLSCGLRWSEAAGVCGDAVDWRAGFLHVRRTVNQAGELNDYGKSSAFNRHVPLTQSLLERLNAASTGPGLIFTTPSGQRRKHADGRLDYRNWLRRVWVPAVTKAKLPGVTPHDCRHSLITWLMAAGVDEYKIQRIVGHTTGRMTRRYTHLRPDHYTELLSAVPTFAPEVLAIEAG